MTERTIHISSIKRQKIGKNRPEDYIIKFDPVLKLSPYMTHEIAMDRLSMTYSWHNINESYKNNTIKYTTDLGVNLETVTFVDGMYSYSDINDYLHQYICIKKNHKTENDYRINLIFVLSSYKVVIEIDNGYQLDLRGTDFGNLIGFNQKVLTQTEYGTMLPNITNSIDVLNVNTDGITDSIVNGVNTNTLAVIPTDNLTRSFPFQF